MHVIFLAFTTVTLVPVITAEPRVSRTVGFGVPIKPVPERFVIVTRVPRLPAFGCNPMTVGAAGALTIKALAFVPVLPSAEMTGK